MVNAATILANKDKTLQQVEIPELGERQYGKVRDFYSYNGQRVTITTDRLSAFDVVLGLIPFKGSVLNQLAHFWFEQTKHIIPNHVISMPDPNVLISHECQPISVEMVVRGYMTGVAITSIWTSYQKGEREIYGITFPDGLKKNDQLPQPVITPTTHGGGTSGHDDRLTREQIIDGKIVPEELYEQMETAALALFTFGQEYAKTKGLILVDTKYEFGLVDGKLTLMDEIHTPDSSRFWKADHYDQRLEAGEEQDNFDKEFLRIWYADRGYRGDGEPPAMTDELIVQVAQRYIETYEILTGQTFEPYEYPINERIETAIKKELGL